MADTVSERYPCRLEQEVTLLKYDLVSSVPRVVSSCVDEDIIHLEDFGVPRLPYSLHWSMDRCQVNRLRDTLDICLGKLEVKSSPLINSPLNNLNCFMMEYEGRHLKCRKNVSSVIDKYLSWFKNLLTVDDEWMNHYNIFFICKRIFFTCFNVLNNAEVTDCNVWKKLFSFTNNEQMMNVIIDSLDPDKFRCLLRHISRKDGNEVDILSQIDIDRLILFGEVNKLKVLLEFNACHLYTLENGKRMFQLYLLNGQYIEPSVMKALTKMYSGERLALLFQMTTVICVAYKILSSPMYKAIKLYWKTVPQAFITWVELEDFLRRLFKYNIIHSHPMHFFVSDVEIVCKMYKRFYGVSLLQPRSLRNYARISARKLYKTADVIDGLNYPENLKSYLNFN